MFSWCVVWPEAVYRTIAPALMKTALKLLESSMHASAQTPVPTEVTSEKLAPESVDMSG